MAVSGWKCKQDEALLVKRGPISSSDGRNGWTTQMHITTRGAHGCSWQGLQAPSYLPVGYTGYNGKGSPPSGFGRTHTDPVLLLGMLCSMLAKIIQN